MATIWVEIIRIITNRILSTKWPKHWPEDGRKLKKVSIKRMNKRQMTINPIQHRQILFNQR